MATSSVYLLSLGVALRNTTYATLSVAVVASALYVASDQGLLETYLLPGGEALARATSVAAPVLFYAAFLSFSVRFMRFGPFSPVVRKAVDGLALVLFALALFTFVSGLDATPILRPYMPYVGITSAVILFGLVLVCAWHATWRALLFLVLWLPLVVTGLSRLLLDALASSSGPLAANGIYFGFAIRYFSSP